MMVAVLITSLICIVLWELFGSGSRAAVYGTWYSARTAELRTGLRMIREDLAKATYTSVITPTNVTVNDGPAFSDHYIGYHGGKTTLPGSLDLITYHICRPDRTAMPTTENQQPADIAVKLSASGTNLHYTRASAGGAVNDVKPEDLYDRDLIRDVEWIEITLTPQATGDSTGTLAIRVKCKYPTEPQKGCEETTTCKLNLTYKTIP